ncbi:MAG: sugar transporter substrate-binding protein [Microbacterium sp.]|nr:sugar transporter substrate-binding protein [Microbacterium sp.]
MIRSQRRRLVAPIALLGVAGLALAGCAEGGSSDGGSVEGQTVQISGGITGVEADDLNASFTQFTEDTGIKVEYTGDKSFEGNIVTKVTGGSAPDIAIVPQPGLLRALIDTGEVQPAPEAVEANVDENWSEDWKSYGTVDDTFYAAPMLANVKGYVWYSPASFAEWGVEVPTTYDELLTLTQTIKDKTGSAPWCAGFASDAASGWPGTDWVEDLVLRQSGGDVYDEWVANEVPFTDPQIKEAFDAVGEILLNPEYVNANFLEAKTAAGEAPTIAPDGDVYAFLLPGIEADGETYVEAGGEFVAAFSDSEAVQQVLEFMSTPEFADARVELGGVISANKGADPSLASSEFLTDAMTLLQDPATVVRFDASDLMPATVGNGSFWKGMVNWIDGRPTDQVLSDIQAGYDN